jgi:hypothetical protein
MGTHRCQSQINGRRTLLTSMAIEVLNTHEDLGRSIHLIKGAQESIDLIVIVEH